MKHPITPEYLQNAPDKIVRLYEDLEAYIIRHICSRFDGVFSATALEHIRLLQRRGYDIAEVEERIRKTLGLTRKQFEAVMNDTVELNRQYYDATLDRAGLTLDTFSELEMQNELDAIMEQTDGEFVNITQSLGFAVRNADGSVSFLPVAETYQKILDDAEIQVWSGAVGYNEAVTHAVKRLTDSGLQIIDYSTGWHNRADVAARRAVMTGVSQLSSKYSEKVRDILNTDLVEVSAHIGARDTGVGYENHKEWQGKVYRWTEKPKTSTGDYPDFVKTTGYGEGGGLCGWNCRHMFYPFYEGISERVYTDEQLANLDPPPFKFEGKTYNAYQATQFQRKIETEIRKAKREMMGYESAGQTEKAATSAVRFQVLHDKYAKFCDVSGLRPQLNRTVVQGFSEKVWRENFKLGTTNTSIVLRGNFGPGGIPKGSTITRYRLIASGEDGTFRDAAYYAADYGGNVVDWKKMSGIIKGKTRSYEVHWVQHGKKKYDEKYKKVVRK